MKGISESITEALARDTMEFGGISLSRTHFKYRFMVYDSNAKEVFVLQFENLHIYCRIAFCQFGNLSVYCGDCQLTGAV